MAYAALLVLVLVSHIVFNTVACTGTAVPVLKCEYRTGIDISAAVTPVNTVCSCATGSPVL